MTDTRNESSTPRRLSRRKTAYEAAHQMGWNAGGVPKIAVMYDPMKYTMTAGVRMYSMLSASPVTMPPQGPIALRANEYAAPVCGNAGDISARLKMSPQYIAAITKSAASIEPKPF